MKYENILSKLSPKVLLDHYWMILDLIEWWEFSTASLEFTVDGILKHLSEEQSRIDNPNYRRECIRAQKVVEEVIAQLTELELIERERTLYKGEKVFGVLLLFKEKHQRQCNKESIMGSLVSL